MQETLFTQEMKEKAAEFLEKIAPSAVCDYCKADVWEMAEEIFVAETLCDSGMAHPYITLMCTKCTNSKFFNAVAMGIL